MTFFRGLTPFLTFAANLLPKTRRGLDSPAGYFAPYRLFIAYEYFGGMPRELVFDQDSVVCVSENAGDIVYTYAFDTISAIKSIQAK